MIVIVTMGPTSFVRSRAFRQGSATAAATATDFVSGIRAAGKLLRPKTAESRRCVDRDS